MRLGVNTLFLVPGDVGGTETYLRETLRSAVLGYPNVEFILFTNKENHQLFQEMFAGRDNVRCVCLRFKAAIRPLRIVLEQLLLPVAARIYKTDILWSPGYTAPLWSFCRQVVTVCDLQYKSFPEDMTWLERSALDFLVRGACRTCDAVLAISEFSRQELINYGFVDEARAHTVLLGVDASFGHAIPENEKTRCLDALSLDRPFILCVAHSYPHKKVHLLIDAFCETEDRIPHTLVVVGRPRRGEQLIVESLKSMKNRERYLRFDRGLPYRTLQILYQCADMFVLPSAYEGFGLPVVEAMLAGTPVITTGEAALKEVSASHAFLVDQVNSRDIAENILKVSSLSAEERAARVAAAKKWASTFSWEESTRKMFEVFAGLSKLPVVTHAQGKKT